MQGGGVQPVQLVLLLLLVFVAVFGAVARRLQTPYPIVLLVAGLALSFIPGIPQVTLDPELVFFVFLPPLLYAGAWLTSWRDFSYNLVSIVSLAVGLVAFTVLGVAFTARWAFAGFDWRLGIVLGAVVAPTDAIAATTIAKRLGLPRRIVDVLEGESLVNDATGLLALEFGIAMVVYGQTPGLGEAALRLCWLTAGGIGIGLAIGRLIEWFELQIDDAPIEITVSILVPYTAYLAAQAVRASGVLAVVASGLYLSRQSTRFFSPRVRIEVYAVWNALTFILNGVVFVLIGLQLPYVLAGIRGQYGLRALLLYGALFSALVVLLRLFWVFPGAHLAYFIRRRLVGHAGRHRPGGGDGAPPDAFRRETVPAAEPDYLPHLLRHRRHAGGAGAEPAGGDPRAGARRRSRRELRAGRGAADRARDRAPAHRAGARQGRSPVGGAVRRSRAALPGAAGGAGRLARRERSGSAPQVHRARARVAAGGAGDRHPAPQRTAHQRRGAAPDRARPRSPRGAADRGRAPVSAAVARAAIAESRVR